MEKTKGQAAAETSQAEPPAEPRGPSAADVARAVGGEITVYKRTKSGEIVRDPKGRPVVETVKFAAEHVASFDANDRRLIVVGIDGRKRVVTR